MTSDEELAIIKALTTMRAGRRHTVLAALGGTKRDEIDRVRRRYFIYLLMLFDRYGLENPEHFIEMLKKANVQNLTLLSDLSYHGAKGMHPRTPHPYRDFSFTLVNSFADKFQADLKARAGTMDYRRRTFLYGEGGYRMATVNGVQAAMRERGATHWRRVIQSQNPCALCLEDSRIIHSIEDPFQSLHPGEQCSMDPLGIRYSGQGSDSEYGIPGVTPSLADEFLGNDVERNVGRKA